MESLENEAIEIFKKIKDAEEKDELTRELYNELLDILAEIAVENGVTKAKFFHEATKIMPFESDDQLNDDDESQEPSASGEKKKKKRIFTLKNVLKVAKIAYAGKKAFDFLTGCVEVCCDE